MENNIFEMLSALTGNKAETQNTSNRSSSYYPAEAFQSPPSQTQQNDIMPMLLSLMGGGNGNALKGLMGDNPMLAGLMSKNKKEPSPEKEEGTVPKDEIIL